MKIVVLESIEYHEFELEEDDENTDVDIAINDRARLKYLKESEYIFLLEISLKRINAYFHILFNKKTSPHFEIFITSNISEPLKPKISIIYNVPKCGYFRTVHVSMKCPGYMNY